MRNQQLPTTLTKHYRNGLLEEEHFGFITKVCANGKILETFGETFDEPFYLRSCEKPLQASLAIDYNLDLTEKELALACGSNAGEKCHYEIALEFANKFHINAKDLKCGIHKPLSKTHQAEMLYNGEKETVFHNNCIGKHLTMLALCKKLGFSTCDYDSPEHPLQKLIIKKVNELCQINKDYPISEDGCGVPVHSMPLKNMVVGFINLFCNPKYLKIKNAILKNPYIFGGEDRTDTKIIQSTGLICKVGAGGLCIVINSEIKEGFVVKISDCDMKSRELITCAYINNLGWGNCKIDKTIKTLHDKEIGEIKTIFDF